MQSWKNLAIYVTFFWFFFSFYVGLYQKQVKTFYHLTLFILFLVIFSFISFTLPNLCWVFRYGFVISLTCNIYDCVPASSPTLLFNSTLKYLSVDMMNDFMLHESGNHSGSQFIFHLANPTFDMLFIRHVW